MKWIYSLVLINVFLYNGVNCQCSQDELSQCTRMAPDLQNLDLVFQGYDENSLDNTCRQVQPGIRCYQNLINKCGSQDFPRVVEFLGSTGRLIEQMCSRGSSYRNEILNLGTCLNNFNTKFNNQCQRETLQYANERNRNQDQHFNQQNQGNQDTRFNNNNNNNNNQDRNNQDSRFNNNQDRFGNNQDRFNQDGTNQDRFSQDINRGNQNMQQDRCCNLFRYHKCTEDKAAEVCGEKGRHFMKKSVQLSTESSMQECEKYRSVCGVNSASSIFSSVLFVAMAAFSVFQSYL